MVITDCSVILRGCTITTMTGEHNIRMLMCGMAHQLLSTLAHPDSQKYWRSAYSMKFWFVTNRFGQNITCTSVINILMIPILRLTNAYGLLSNGYYFLKKGPHIHVCSMITTLGRRGCCPCEYRRRGIGWNKTLLKWHSCGKY